MALSLQELKNIWIPKSIWNRPNNLSDAQAGVQIYNDSVNLYEAILATAAITSSIDLTASFTSTSGTITPSGGGLAAVLTAATTVNAGLMTAVTLINHNALVALDGVAPGATNLGTFVGNIIPDNTTIKNALQSLEIAIETAGSPTLGDILSTTLDVTGGINKVYGADVTIDLDPSTIDIGDLSGDLDLTQLPNGTTSGQTFVWNGTSWVIQTPTVSAHNSLTGIQGGLTNERYHLALSLYNKLTASPTNRLIGRSTAGTGEVEAVTPGRSVELNTGILQLVGDLGTPGNNRVYGTNGSGVKGWYALSNGSVTTITGVDNDDIDITITNPTTTPSIEAALRDTTVTSGSYGTASSVGSFTVDDKGRLTAANNVAIQITTSQVTSFTNTVNNIIAGNLTAGTGITIDDSNPAAIIISSTATAYTDEMAQDAVGLILLDSADIDLSYNDLAPTITAALTTTGVTAGSYGSGGTSVPNFTVDSKGRITAASTVPIAIPVTQVTNFEEAVDDRVANLLQAGTGISLVYNDVLNTLTISSTGMGSGYDTVQNMGVSMPQQDTINFNTNGFQVSNDGPNTRTNVGLTSNLAQIGVIGTGGFFVRDLGGTIDTREIMTGTSPAITIQNGNGFLGNPTIYLNLIGGFQNLQVPPAADRIFFYDFSAGASTYLSLGSGLSITGTVLNATFTGVLDDLSDVVITAPANGQLLQFNGTNWVNWTPTYIGPTSPPATGDIMYWNGTGWEPVGRIKNVQIGLSGNSVILPSTPISNMPIDVYFNGLLQEEGSDYTRTGTTLNFVVTFVPLDKVTTIYYN